MDIADARGFIPPRSMAAAATAEAESRELKIAKLIVAGKAPPEAQVADWEAWLAIERWLRRERIDFPWSYEEMEEAASRARGHLGRLCQEKPGDTALAARRDTAEAIHSGLQRTRALYDQLNADLRRTSGHGAAASGGAGVANSDAGAAA